MWKRIQNLLMQGEWKLSLWGQIFGAGGLLTSFGITAWAGSATEWIGQHGPLAWVGTGFFGALLFALLVLMYSLSKSYLAQAALNEKRAAGSTRINPLQDHFTKEIITVADIFSHFHQVHKNKHFRECRFSGPMVMAFANNISLSHPEMSDCNFVVVGEGWITGVVAFADSSFRDCEFDSVTFLIPPNFARAMRDEIEGRGGNVPSFLGLPI